MIILIVIAHYTDGLDALHKKQNDQYKNTLLEFHEILPHNHMIQGSCTKSDSENVNISC